MKILGISGKANVGKTTFLKRIIESDISHSKGYIHLGSWLKAEMMEDIITNQIFGSDDAGRMKRWKYISIDLELVDFFRCHNIVSDYAFDLIAVNKNFYSICVSELKGSNLFGDIIRDYPDVTVGVAVQKLVDKFKAEDKDFFVRKSIRKLENINADIIFIDGVRYDSDVKWIVDSLDGKILNIAGKQFINDGRDTNHSSEKDSLHYDFIYDNGNDKLMNSEGKKIDISELYK